MARFVGRKRQRRGPKARSFSRKRVAAAFTSKRRKSIRRISRPNAGLALTRTGGMPDHLNATFKWPLASYATYATPTNGALINSFNVTSLYDPDATAALGTQPRLFNEWMTWYTRYRVRTATVIFEASISSTDTSDAGKEYVIGLHQSPNTTSDIDVGAGEWDEHISDLMANGRHCRYKKGVIPGLYATPRKHKIVYHVKNPWLMGESTVELSDKEGTTAANPTSNGYVNATFQCAQGTVGTLQVNWNVTIIYHAVLTVKKDRDLS